MTARRKWPIVLGSILGVLVIAVVIGLFVLDGILTSQAHAQAQKLTTQLGRPVKIGSVATKLFSGLAVRVSDVSVGAAAGEKLPLLTIARIEVKAALLKALTSKGEDVEVQSAEVSGLTVNIVKDAEGKTNLERLQEKLAEEPKKAEVPKKDDKPTDLSRITVDHFALLEGTVRFIDESGKADKKLEIQHLSIVVNDLHAGKPLDVVVKAAVLSAKENFLLQLHAAPLPPTLIPTPEKIVLKIQPIDLQPIAAFVPKSVGLEAGHLAADFDMQLGAAVPGGTGNTSVKGTVNATGLQFAGAEGGRALDVVLDTDLDADAVKGDVQIRKLKLDFGPAGISGTGKALGLKSGAPRVEGLQIVSHDLDPARLAALYPPLRAMIKGQIAGPIGLTIHGSGSQAQQAVEVVLDFTPVKLSVPLTLTKAPGAKMVVTAHVKGAAAGGGALGFDLHADLSGVDLRPGDSINKKPGDPLDLSIEGTKSGGANKKDPTKIAITSLTAHLLDAAFTGAANVELAGVAPHATTTFTASLKSAKVDADKLLLPSKKKEKKPEPDPKTYAGLHGTAEVKIDDVRFHGQEMTNVVAQIVLNEDDLLVKTAQLSAYGGRISADGSHLKLAHPNEPFQAKVKMENIDLEKGLTLVSDKKVMSGKFNGDITLDGHSMEPEALKKTLAGLITGSIADGQFYGKDLIASVSGPLASKLPFGLAGKTGTGGTTSLGKQLPFGLVIENGRANLKEGLKIARPEAGLTLSGGLTLEGMLDLGGTAELTPAFISTLTGGKATVTGPVPIGFKLGGPAWKPEVTDIQLGNAVQTIAKSAGAALIGKFLPGAAGAKANEILQGGPDKARQEAQAAVQAKVDQERKVAEDRARAEADKQKKKLEDEAKNRLKGLFGK